MSLRPKPWFDTYSNHNPEMKVIIIGGGISGITTAYSLANRGYNVTIYEQGNAIASGASGNYQAILYGSFKSSNPSIKEFSYTGYNYSLNLIKNILPHNPGNCGLIELAQDETEYISHQKIAATLPSDFCRIVDQDEINKLSGSTVICKSGLYFPNGLWVNPFNFLNQLIKHPNIKVICNTLISDISRHNNITWNVISNGQIIDNAHNIVVCNADKLNEISLFSKLSIRKIRGQISIINNKSPTNIILCGNGYITPNFDNKYTIGATFDFRNLNTIVTGSDHLTNIKHIKNMGLNISDNIHEIAGNAAIRASTYDYMPLVGPIANYDLFIERYAKLKLDSNYWLTDKCPYLHGIYLNIGHGAKGLSTAPICGEIIADYITNNKSSLSETLRLALHPNRVYVRNLVKHNSNNSN